MNAPALLLSTVFVRNFVRNFYKINPDLSHFKTGKSHGTAIVAI